GHGFSKKGTLRQNVWILHWRFTLTNGRASRSEPPSRGVVRQIGLRNLESRGVSTRAASTVPSVVNDTATRTLPWYRQVTGDQWRAFWAVFLGWIVDSFDFNILAFIVVDIQKSFTVDRALAGALGTVTLMMRLVGGTLSGTAADKWGRKLPLMLSVLWFSLFAFLSGFAPTYAVLFGIRALFGLGMGGEWA